MADVYKRNGYLNRQDYFEQLADEYGIDIDTITILADTLGPNEDFDGLVSILEDM